MNGFPPLIRLISYDEDGEFQLLGTHEVAVFGCVPAVGDVMSDDLIDDAPPSRVRRRVFVPKTAEPDVWWLFLEGVPDDNEAIALRAFDQEMRDEFKAIEEEYRLEQKREFEAEMVKRTKNKKKGRIYLP